MGSMRAVGTIFVTGWRASPARMTASFVLLLLNYVSWPLAPLVLKHVTDAVVAQDVARATVAAAFLPLVAYLSYTGSHIAQTVWVELADLYLIRVGQELGDLSQEPVGIQHHERADYADRLELMRNEGNALYRAVTFALQAVAFTAQAVITIILFVSVQPLLLVILAFGVVPVIAGRRGWAGVEAIRLATADQARRAQHLLDLAVDREAAKEIRVFGLQEELRGRLRRARDQLHRQQSRAEVRSAVIIAIGHLAFAVAFVTGLVLVVRGAIAGRHSVGDVVLVLTLAVQVNALVGNAVGTTVWLQRSAAAMQRLSWLRQLVTALNPATTSDASVPDVLRDSIRFDHVSFRYPGTTSRVLTDIDLTLPAGATVAFVGENGAGKTTLVNLLCRFYEPDSGRITVDGIDLKRLPVDQWRARIAAGFQDFVRWELTARESVGVGDLPHIDNDAVIVSAINRAAATDVIEPLPAGLQTSLGKTYEDGAELSGGQWQKIALARAMMRTKPLLLILDEPTAALDAHAEHTLFQRYANSARAIARTTGGIAIFVSHRFSTVRMADHIVVIDRGEIIEQGGHAELLARDGLYAELFHLQADAYS